MKFLVDIPDEANFTADEVCDALRFGVGYWNEMLGPLLDAIRVAPAQQDHIQPLQPETR